MIVKRKGRHFFHLLFFFSLLFSLLCVKKRLKRQKSFYHFRPLNLNLRWPSLRIANEKQPCTHKVNKNGNTGATWREDLFIFSSAKSAFFFFLGSRTHVTKHLNTSSTILYVLHFLLLLCTITYSSLLHFQPNLLPPFFGPLNGLHCLLISYLEPSSTVSVEPFLSTRNRTVVL